MKLEKLSKGKFIKTSIIVLITISIVGVIFINKSKAKYRVTQSIQVVSGEVNYKVPDLNVLALYKQKVVGNTDDNNYESITDVPTGSYKVNTDKSYCTIVGNDTQLKDIPMEYKDNKVYIGIKRKGTKCYVYLDIDNGTSGTDLLASLKVNSTSDGCPAYEDAPSVTSVKSSGSLFCKGKDDFGDTYYFRGNPTNNWVKIGNFYWRIIRFNGNGSIRLIYSGSGSAQTSGTGTQLNSTSAYNNQYNNANYVKYMNGSADSTIKGVLDSWYNTNLKSTYGSKMDGSVGFCNDADNGTYSSGIQFFKPHDRIYPNEKPTFKCGTPTTNLFTTSGGTKGNQKLTNPIGLITIDEASFAGGLWVTDNPGYYLYTNSIYWTMSPSYFNSNSVRVFVVDNNGNLLDDYVSDGDGVRPVINLRSDTLFKTTSEVDKGTADNPYIVQ